MDAHLVEAPRPRGLRFGPLAGGFAIAVVVWMTAFVARLPIVELSSPALLILLLGMMFAGSVVIAARLRAEDRQRAIICTMWTLVIAGLVNVLLVGSVVGAASLAAAESGVDGSAGSAGPDDVRRISLSALVWIPGSLIATGAIGLAGGAVGSLFNRNLTGSAPAGRGGFEKQSRTVAEQAALALVMLVTTLCLIFVGGVVTSAEVGLAVPDWPTSFGWNMFLFPFSKMVGGIYYEHAHRLIGSLVGLETMVLFIWLWIRPPFADPSLARIRCQRCGYSLAGLHASRCPECGQAFARETEKITRETLARDRRFAWLGTAAFILVCVQGVLGGGRVELVNRLGHDAALKVAVLHAMHAQLFLVSVVVLAWWLRERARSMSAEGMTAGTDRAGTAEADRAETAEAERADSGFGPAVRVVAAALVPTVVLQSLIGAILRHFETDWALAAHLAGAGMVFTVVMVLSGIVLTRPIGQSAEAMRPVRAMFALFILTAFQVALGFGAWWVTARYERLDQVTYEWIIFLTAGHVVVGAAVLACATLGTLETFRFRQGKTGQIEMIPKSVPTIASRPAQS